jgi:Tat protein secretion system quality control protein TatD with DNase activity
VVPPGQLLTETDNPGGPKGFIGDHGMPSLIKDVVRALAALRGVSAETIVQTVQTNFETLVQDDMMLANRYQSLLDDPYDSI